MKRTASSKCWESLLAQLTTLLYSPTYQYRVAEAVTESGHYIRMRMYPGKPEEHVVLLTMAGTSPEFDSETTKRLHEQSPNRFSLEEVFALTNSIRKVIGEPVLPKSSLRAMLAA